MFSLGLILSATTGCAWMAHMGTDLNGLQRGKTYYIGGAGPIGNIVGTHSVPRGLRDGGYEGAIEVFVWQAPVGGTLRDQMDRARNEEQGRKLAESIQRYLTEYPDHRVNIIALSAGTGVATWALESLPDGVEVGTVIYLGSSLSRRYDLSRALDHVAGQMHNFYSTRDPILRYGMPLAGSVDRGGWWPSVAGLYGFGLPPNLTRKERLQYRLKLWNHPFHQSYERYGYRGHHTDAAKRRFVEHVITPLLLTPLPEWDTFDYPEPPAIKPWQDPTTQPYEPTYP